MSRNQERPPKMKDLTNVEAELQVTANLRDMLSKLMLVPSLMASFLATYVDVKLPPEFNDDSWADWLLHAEPQGSLEQRQKIVAFAGIVVAFIAFLDLQTQYYSAQLNKYRQNR